MHVTVHPIRDVRLERDDGADLAMPIAVGTLSPCENCKHAAHPKRDGVSACSVEGCSCATPVHSRTITETDARAAAAHVVALLVAHDVDSVTMKQNRGTGAYARDGAIIAAAIETAARAAGIAVDEAAGKATNPNHARDARRAGGVTLEVATPDTPAAVVELSSAIVAATSPTWGTEADIAAGRVASSSQEPERPRGERVAGVDPGSGSVGVAIGELQDGRVHYIEARTIEVGRVIRGKRDVNTDDLAELAAALVALLREHGVTRVAVERPRAAYGGFNAPEVASSMFVGGGIALACQVAGMKVETVPEATWHALLVPGKRTIRARVGQLGPAVLAAVEGWPARSDEHERDAAGMMVWLVSTKKKPTEPRPKSEKKKPHARRAADRAKTREARRETTGCTCNKRRYHAPTCPARPTPS